MNSPTRIRLVFLVLCLAFPAVARAQDVNIYPVAWPKAGGGTLVAVPVADAKVQIYHMVGAPHHTAFDTPFPTTPELVLDPAPGDEPIILQAPVSPTDPQADEDHFYILLSDQRLVVSMADDERSQPGTPDRIFFMPATSGTYVGRTFYGEANGGDPKERIRVINLSNNVANVELFAWNGNVWQPHGVTSVPAHLVGLLDPSVPMTAYKVTSTQDALVVVGYMETAYSSAANATAQAVDINTGMIVGDDLLGFGRAWFLRAINDVQYTIRGRSEFDTTWHLLDSGSLTADEASYGLLQGVTSSDASLIQITLTGGVGWAIVGTQHMLPTAPQPNRNTCWNGYFLPDQSSSGCLLGTKFFTNSPARTISMMPNAGTTVSIYDVTTNSLVETYTSTGSWEFHNFFYDGLVRVEFTGGPGGVLLVGTLNWGNCDETVDPGRCGILEGGYSLPPVTGFKCEQQGDAGVDLQSCHIHTPGNCMPEPDAAVGPDAGDATPDAALLPDAAPQVDSGSGQFDAAAGQDSANPGCACRTHGHRRGLGGTVWVFLMGLLSLLLAQGRRYRR